MGDLKTLAEALRGVDQWHGLGIDAQAAALLRLPEFKPATPTPTPYTDRGPEPSDLNSEGQCWRFNPAQPGSSSPFLTHDSWVLSSRKIGTHWLPHDAPCLPTNFTVNAE